MNRWSWHQLFLRTLFAALCALPAWAQPAPDWLRNADMVNDWNRENGSIDEHLTQIPLLINVPGEQIAKAHAKGFKGIPYTSSSDCVIDGKAGGRYPFRPDTANALLVDKDGRFVDTLMDGTYRLHRKLVCTNSATFNKVMMEYLKSQMNLGVDGLFIDNVAEDREECYGDGLRIGWSSRYHTVVSDSRNLKATDPRLTDVPVHTHLYPGKSHSYAFRQWLLKVREMVKSYGPDKITIVNGGPVYADCADATMLESYICSWDRKGRSQSWQQLKETAEQYAPYIRKGGAVIALSYVGTDPDTIKDDAFFCFSAARLSNFVWSDYRTIGSNPAAVLYQAHLGRASTPITAAAEGVDYRWFPHGLVVMNGTDKAAELAIPVPPERTLAALNDLYAGQAVPVSAGHVRLQVPAQSGRVYVAR